MVLRFISPDEPRVLVTDFFSLVSVTNTGAAFGSFRGNNTFFIAISSVALVVVLGLLLRARARDHWRDISLALLLAGILGNLTDRLLYGHVIDFLLFDLHVPTRIPGRPLMSPTPASRLRWCCLLFIRSGSRSPRENSIAVIVALCATQACRAVQLRFA